MRTETYKSLYATVPYKYGFLEEIDLIPVHFEDRVD